MAALVSPGPVSVAGDSSNALLPAASSPSLPPPISTADAADRTGSPSSSFDSDSLSPTAGASDSDVSRTPTATTAAHPAPVSRTASVGMRRRNLIPEAVAARSPVTSAPASPASVDGPVGPRPGTPTAPPRIDSKKTKDSGAAGSVQQAEGSFGTTRAPTVVAAATSGHSQNDTAVVHASAQSVIDSLMEDIANALGPPSPILAEPLPITDDLERLKLGAIDGESSPTSLYNGLESTASRSSNESSGSSSRTKSNGTPPSPVPSHPETATLGSTTSDAAQPVTQYSLLSMPALNNKHLANVENDTISLPSRYSDYSYDAASLAESTNSKGSESGISTNDSSSPDDASSVKFPAFGDIKPEVLELYRQNAKRSNDPAVQLEFAKYLFVAAETARELEVANGPQATSYMTSDATRPTSQVLHDEALKWLRRLAHHSSLVSAPSFFNKPPYAEAQFLLAELYAKGSSQTMGKTVGVDADPEKAFALYMQATKQGHPTAAMKTAWCYEMGVGTKKDPARAVFHYRKAAMLGDSFAMYKIGTILLQGRLGSRSNVREGVLWLKRAAQPVASRSNSESPNALFELAQLYDGTCKTVQESELTGIVIQDEAYAYTLYLRAAELGFPPAQYQLGKAYEHGLLGLPVDPRRSIQFYAMAAERSHPEAELALSGWYLTGAEGIVQQSDAHAYQWARKAAEKGLPKAEYAVGYYSENGVGVDADKSEALAWYGKAAAKGNKRAAAKVQELQGSAPPSIHASSSSSSLLSKLKASPSRGKRTAISFLSRSSSNTSLSTLGSTTTN